MRVTIVGGGAIGLSLAWELARRDVAVRLVERGSVGRETSWAAAGILPAAAREHTDDPLDRLRALSHRLYPTWAQTLLEQTGIDSGLRRSGGIYLASSAGEAASLVGNLEYQRELGVELQSLTADELLATEPALAAWLSATRFRVAVLSPDEWQVRPPDFMAALLSACRQAGVVVEEQTKAELVVESEHATLRLRQVHRTSETEPADNKVVICGGAWTGQIAQSLGLAHSVIPIRGQVLMYRFAKPPLRHIVNEGHRYLVPREDGRVLVGSCEEEVGFERGTTEAMLEPLARWAELVLPEVAQAPVEKRWSGLRPATFDGFPMIGKVPSVANLFVAAGHYRSGIHLAPATATVLADMLLGNQTPIDPTAFAVGRMVSNVP